MAIAQYWAGRVFGTNTGNVFVELSGEERALSGILRFNDSVAGIIVYLIKGKFLESKLSLEGEVDVNGVKSSLTMSSSLLPNGNLEGLWNTNSGAGGTLTLFPHQNSQVDGGQVTQADQLYTARNEFEPVKIDRCDIIAIAETVQKSFSNSKVIVTYTDATERSLFLDNFKQMAETDKLIPFLKLFAREPDFGGLDKIVLIEFGPVSNIAMTQGASEAWTLGELEKLKREIGTFERSFVTKKYYSFSLNQFMLAIAVVALPSLGSIFSRAFLIVAVVFLAFIVIKLHNRFLPHASINLGASKESKFMRTIFGSIFSWTLGLLANLIAALLAAYLAGYFNITQILPK